MFQTLIRYNFKTAAVSRLFILGALSVFLWSCAPDDRTPVPEVDHITVSFDTIRYDRALARLDTNALGTEFRQLRKRYPAFTELYFQNIVPIKRQTRKDSLAFLAELQNFLQAPSVRAIQDSVMLEFADLKGLYPDFVRAFRFLKYYFPDRTAPDIYTFISEFSYGAFIFSDEQGDDALGLGLDLFLGDRMDYTRLAAFSSAFSQYLTRTFDKNHLVKKTLDPLVSDIAGPPGGNRFIDYIVHEGKKQYLRDRLLPYTPDSVKWEYTAAQMEWVRDNEWNIYVFIIDEELLYSTDQALISKLVEPAPSSQGMPPESPGRAVNYIGYRIVETYMDRFPETTLRELIDLGDGQRLFEMSGYRPRKQ